MCINNALRNLGYSLQASIDNISKALKHKIGWRKATGITFKDFNF